MLNNKYGNILTMILIVLVVTIIGIVGYFAYDTFHTKQINENAQLALEEFERATTKVKKKTSSTTGEDETNTVSNTTSTSLQDAMALLNTSTENTTVEEQVS